MSFSPSSDDREKAISALLHFCHVRSYPNKTTIIHPGDTGDCLHFIIEGSVSIHVEDDNNHELILAYLNKNNFIGEIGIFKGSEIRQVSVKTRSASKLAEISYDCIHTLLKTDLAPFALDLLYLFGEQLSVRLLTTSRKYSDLAFIDVESRVAHALIDLTKEPDAITHPDGMQLHITRQEIGRIVGCSREMAGRVLKEMENKELISAHGKSIVVFGTR